MMGRIPRVAILMGSESDREKMRPASTLLAVFGVEQETLVLSAHRTPSALAEYATMAQVRGIKVLIAGAGMAAHLAGAIAARTVLPVIGVPLSSGAIGGLDALLSTVQMPNGVPVATVAVDGAENAAFLALQILALSDPQLMEQLETDRHRKAEALTGKACL